MHLHWLNVHVFDAFDQVFFFCGQQHNMRKFNTQNDVLFDTWNLFLYIAETLLMNLYLELLALVKFVVWEDLNDQKRHSDEFVFLCRNNFLHFTEVNFKLAEGDFVVFFSYVFDIICDFLIFHGHVYVHGEKTHKRYHQLFL